MAKTDESIEFSAIEINQPMGTFYVGVMSASDVVAVSRADVRRMEERALDKYLGIQRRLSPSRVKELQAYVNTYDATFPTAILLAVSDKSAKWDPKTRTLRLVSTKEVPLEKIALIIDGQHRIEGLKAYTGKGPFEVNVAIFLGADIATQANIFATVNLAQTKVNRSLVYDLLEYERERSPQKSAHHIAVALDQIPNSPFFERIKRLGSATAGRDDETLTQAAVVESLLALMTGDALGDRDTFLRRIGLGKPTADELRERPFRGLFFQERETDITKIMLEYFGAVRKKWPESWSDTTKEGNVLPKTNGFKALMRFLKFAYLDIVGSKIGSVPTQREFGVLFDDVTLKDDQFTTATFPPGTSGESKLYRILMEDVYPEQIRATRK